MDSNRLEQLQAKRDGAILVPNSGRGQLRKGDARMGDFLIDYKFTEKGSYSVNYKNMRKFAHQAWREGLEPVVVTVFVDNNGETYATLSWEILKGLINDHRA